MKKHVELDDKNQRTDCGSLLPICLLLWTVVAGMAADASGRMVCVGRVEPVDGEVEVCAQMTGTLTAVFAKEGDWITNGTVLAEVDARREKAALALAEARLTRIKAGNGAEEIAAAAARRDALAADLAYAELELKRVERLRAEKTVSEDELDARRQRAESLRYQVAGAQKQYEAMKRGSLPEEIAVAEAEVVAAREHYGLRLVRAPSDGAILLLHRHAGDFVSTMTPVPILRMANTRQLQVRVEVSELDAYRIKTGMKGTLTPFGQTQPVSEAAVRVILPSFAPKRLFEPDSTARLDTRTLQVLCDIERQVQPVFSGQRCVVTFIVAEQSQ